VDELIRHKMHEALDVEQPDSRLRSRILSSLPAGELPKRWVGRLSFRWAGGLVAALLAVAVVAGLLYSRAALSPPHSTGTAAPPVVYIQRSPGWQLIDWTGKAQGLIGSEQVGNPYQSPDGSRVAWQPQGDWQVVDRKGKVLSHLDLSRSRSIAWADDSSGLCVIRQLNDNQPPGAGPYVLDFVSATSGASKMIASFTIGMGPDIAACSPTSGRVVIVSASGFKDPRTMQEVITFGALRVIDLKTGTVAFSQAFPVSNRSSEVNWIVVSHDGAFAALQTETETRIVDLTSGRVVLTMDSLVPWSFSWDDARLAVGAGPIQSRGEVVDISNGHLLWTDSVAGRVTQGAVAEPGAGDLMLFVTTGEFTDLVVVTASGAYRTIAKNVFPVQIGPCPNCSAL
jgi:hypothetical protein